MLFHLKMYHPGIPGYALKYDYYVTFKGEKLAFEEYDVDFNLPTVWITADRIVIPDYIRQRGETLTITVRHKKYPQYSSTIHIKMRKYELTLEDNFETYNTDLWEGVPYGAKTDMSITPVLDNYVHDGQLCLDFKKLDKPIIKNGKEYYYTDTGDDFHGCGEIDIMEIFDHPDTLGSAHTEHYWAPGWTDDMPKTKSTLGENYIIPGFQYGQYQEYSCVWNEYGLYYYVNGELAKANINIAPVEDVNEAFIKFTCYIGPKGSNAFYGEVEDKDLPQTLYVDWLRVYK